MDSMTVQNERRAVAAGVVAGGPGAGSADAGNVAGVGKNDFLKLLVAQLRNQDPMKPMEDAEFIAQMAQLNTVEQLTAMNTRLGEFLDSETVLQASALLGKMVLAEPADAEPVAGLVEEVRLDSGGPVLVVEGKEVLLSDITRISPAT